MYSRIFPLYHSNFRLRLFECHFFYQKHLSNLESTATCKRDKFTSKVNMSYKIQFNANEITLMIFFIFTTSFNIECLNWVVVYFLEEKVLAAVLSNEKHWLPKTYWFMRNKNELFMHSHSLLPQRILQSGTGLNLCTLIEIQFGFLRMKTSF